MLKKYKFALILVSIITIVGFSLGGISYKPALAAEPIKIGVVGAISGAATFSGVQWINAIQIAASEINESGGILGRPIELLVKDSGTKVDIGVREARNLITRNKVDFLLGAVYSSVCLAVSEVAKEYKTIMIDAVGNTEEITVEKGHRYVFAVVPNTGMEARAAAQIAAKQPWERYAVLAPDFVFGHSGWNSFIAELKRLKPNVQVVAEQWPPLAESDFNPYIAAIMAQKPDAVWCGLFGGYLSSFAKQAVPLGFFKNIKLLSLIQEIDLMGVKEFPEGQLGFNRGSHYCDDTPEMKAFVQRYKENYGTYASSYAIMGYDSLYALKSGIEKAGTIETEAVVDALEGLTLRSLRGEYTIRAFDHQATVPEYVGWTAWDSRYPDFVILKDVVRVPGEKTILSVEQVKERRTK